MKSILDRDFHYTNAANTDLRKTFARIKREKRKQEQELVRRQADDKLIRISRVRTSMRAGR